MSGIERLAETIADDMAGRLPGQRKTQRGKLSLLVAGGAQRQPDGFGGLPASARGAVGHPLPGIKRLLANARVVSDAVMAPYGREVLARLAARGQTIVLIIDQTKASERHQVRDGGGAPRRPGAAAGLAGQGDRRRDRLFEQREALEAAARLLPQGVKPVLMGDRFYGSPDLIGHLQELCS